MNSEGVTRWTFALALALAILGTSAYVASGRQSWTALIPAVFGVLIAIAGWNARHPRRRPYALVAALALSFMGIVGTLKGFLQLPDLIQGAAVERPTAVIVQSTMAVLCAVYFVPGIAHQMPVLAWFRGSRRRPKR